MNVPQKHWDLARSRCSTPSDAKYRLAVHGGEWRQPGIWRILVGHAPERRKILEAKQKLWLPSANGNIFAGAIIQKGVRRSNHHKSLFSLVLLFLSLNPSNLEFTLFFRCIQQVTLLETNVEALFIRVASA